MTYARRCVFRHVGLYCMLRMQRENALRGPGQDQLIHLFHHIWSEQLSLLILINRDDEIVVVPKIAYSPTCHSHIGST